MMIPLTLATERSASSIPRAASEHGGCLVVVDCLVRCRTLCQPAIVESAFTLLPLPHTFGKSYPLSTAVAAGYLQF